MTEKPKIGGRKRSTPNRSTTETAAPGKRPSGRTAGGKGNGAGHGASLHGSAGEGWGGSPKGDGAGPEALEPGCSAAKRESTRLKQLTEAEAAAEMRSVIFGLAHGAEREETRLSAANAMLNRLEGQPFARNLNANVSNVSGLSDDEIRGELERLSRAATAAASGTETPPVPRKPGSMVQ